MPVTINGTTGISTPDGSASVPPYTGSSGATNGLYFPSATTAAITTNGTQALYIDASQNVGIGTASPAYKLHVAGNVTINNGSQYCFGSNNYNGMSGDATSNFVNFYTNNGERLRIDSSGNVGIGTSSPSSYVSAKSLVIQTDGGASSGLYIYSPSATNGARIVLADNLYNATINTVPSGGSTDLSFTVSGTQSLYIKSGGNVGIATATPYCQLDVYSNINGPTTGEATGVGSIRITNGASALSSSGGLEFKIAGDTNGYGSKIQAINSGGSQLAFANRSASATWVERMRLDSSGALNINNTSALNGNAKLSIWNVAGSAFGFATGYGTGTSQFRLIYLTSAANALNFDNGANNATLSSAGAWTNASDASLKKNIKGIKYGLIAVNETKPRSFNRVDVDGDYIGFVAQELEEVIPEVVWHGDKNLTVDYGSLVAVAFKAIQELAAEVEALKKKVA